MRTPIAIRTTIEGLFAVFSGSLQPLLLVFGFAQRDLELRDDGVFQGDVHGACEPQPKRIKMNIRLIELPFRLPSGFG